MSLPIDPKTQDSFLVEDDRVILFDEFAEEIIQLSGSYTEFPDTKAKFLEQFEVVGTDFLQPDEDFYQGLNFVTVIRRKSDGRQFGYERWEPVAKNAETYLEPNGDDHGFEWDIPMDINWDDDYIPDAYVFTPVEPVMLPGFKFVEASK